MKSSVIVFPGSNCDRDIAVALEKMQFKNKMVWHKDTSLPKSDLIVIPGGFSYGDYLRSGAIAGKSLIIDEVIKAANSGCLILGICNGFQILTETKLLPGTLIKNSLRNAPWNNKFLHKKGLHAITSVENSGKAIENGENNFGITIHYMDDGIDTGDILVQKKYQFLVELFY